jgi:hypothetical protein
MIQEGNTYYLSRDAVGPYSGRLYASRGEKITVISIHNSMAIAEIKGGRFPVKLEAVTEEHPGNELTAAAAPASAGVKRRTNKKLKTNSSSTFF